MPINEAAQCLYLSETKPALAVVVARKDFYELFFLHIGTDALQCVLNPLIELN